MMRKYAIVCLFMMGILGKYFGQSASSAEMVAKNKAIFMYGFTKFFQWSGQKAQGEFKIAVIGATEEFKNALQSIADLKQVDNRKIRIYQLDDLSEMDKMPMMNMLYVDVEKQPEFKLREVPYQTLVVSENEKQLKNTMINFVFIESKLKFSFNTLNTKALGISYNESFEKLAYDLEKDLLFDDNHKSKKKRQSEEMANSQATPETKVENSNKETNTESNSKGEEKQKESVTIVGPLNSSKTGAMMTAKLKAIFMYGFTRYFEWPKENTSGDFRIGLLGADEDLKLEFEKLARIKKVGTQNIELVYLNDKNELKQQKPLNILYYNLSKVSDFSVNDVPKQTLTISDNDAKYYRAMVNFVWHEDKLKFGLNAFLTNNKGLVVKDDFKRLALFEYEPSLEEKKEIMKDLGLKVGMNESKNDPTIAAKLDNSSTAGSTKELSGKSANSIKNKKIINTEWEELINKIKTNLDEVVLSKEESIQIANKFFKQEKDLEQQQLAIDFQMSNIDMQRQLMEKQEQDLKLKEAKLQSQHNELNEQLTKINRQQTIIWLSLVAISAVVFGIFMVFNTYQKSKKTNLLLSTKNEEIETQKLLIEEKQHEIIDSIHYAQRIQKAMLAKKEVLDSYLKDYFILFKPKDVVSGDFYWAQDVLINQQQQLLLITADSTGHGVPGSIMSMLNISCIEKAVEVEKLTAPRDIINHTRIKVIESLKRDGSLEGGKDGMDCTILLIDFRNKKMTYAAANNPIWVMRSNKHDLSDSSQILELEPDKMPVGKHDKDQIPFQQHELQLEKGDIIYTFTDGLADQFGGPKGKKFMYKQMKALLISVASLSMHDQQVTIEKALKDWMGENEQVDDITLIGIRV